MNGKDSFEWHFFTRFQELYLELPNGEIEKTESPDFLIRTDSDILGVEISKLLNKKESHEKVSPVEKDSLEQRVSKMAEQLFLARKKLPLHLTIEFTDNYEMSKADIEPLANNIADLVDKVTADRPIDKQFEFRMEVGLPRPITYLSGHFFPKVKTSVWYSSKGKFLGNLPKTQLIEAIEKKEKKLKEYRQKCDNVILLLVEGIPPESWFDKIELPTPDEVETDFSRIFVLRNLDNQLIPVK